MTISAKHLFIGLLAIVAVVAGYFAWQWRPYQIANLDSQGTTVVAFGDSLVHGVGSRNQGDFISLLSAKIGEPIINLGKSGDTTASALERLDAIFQHNPKIVIVLLGGNDFLRRIPMETTFQNLDRIVRTIQSHGAAVLLLGVRGGLLYDSYDSRFASFARERHAAFVPNVLDGLLGNDSLMSDTIHPNNDGYIRIADKVYPVLKDMLEEIREKRD